VIVASDGRGQVDHVHRTGDEPQMLARQLPGVVVLVSSDRYLAGRLAEQRFGCSVHLLDDGFQHLQLRRDVDLLMLSPRDLDDRPLPSGRLREPLSAIGAADVVIVNGSESDMMAVASVCEGRPVFRAVIRAGSLLPLRPSDAPGGDVRRVVAVAGIARPERFFQALRDQELEVVRELRYRDHHWFTAGDIEAIERAAQELGVDAIATTQKDAVRLAAVGPRWAVLPISLSIEPSAVFDAWLFERLRAARAA
jgi:tetraacyldisaccharide 4'-kinase